MVELSASLVTREDLPQSSYLSADARNAMVGDGYVQSGDVLNDSAFFEFVPST